jgi:hypothetical protein
VRAPAKNEREALRRYKQVLQRSLGCVTPAIWITGATERDPDVHYLTTSEDPIRVPTDAGGGYVYLSASQNFRYDRHGRFPGEWKVTTLGYVYRVALGPSQDDSIVAWHWHPSTKAECHVHSFSSHGLLPGGLGELHLPTGRVSIEQILRFLILDLGVRARVGWEQAIGESEARFNEYKSWG